jgi:class 3 adenylate cyclase
MFINRYLRDKSHEAKMIPLPSNKSPSVNNDLSKKSFTTDENDSDSTSLIDNIVRSSQEKNDDSKVTIEKKMLAQVVYDHFKFYNILHKMLPPKAVDELNRGEQVIPEEFESVTIFFSDIVGFTEITSKVDHLLVVTLLNQLYSVMDYCASFFNIFKVETIGDAYMTVGGMNDEDDNNQHASNIADFALLVMKACELVKSPYDGTPIRLRIGLHSGPVAAGVVGTVMPRFCLFGNTVNVAHRMESNSEVAKIQCSKCTASLIERNGTHNLEKRGMVDCKGLGRIETYWVCSMNEEHAKS